MPPSISHVTLPQLQRLYSQSYTRLVGEAALQSTSVEDAHRLVQDAFARAARIRFTFESEPALLAWMKEAMTTAAGAGFESEALRSSASPQVEIGTDWDDVLRRASIAVTASAPVRPTAPLSGRARLQLPTLLRRLADRRETLD
jgi:DNA-directed RNA polymerase specialized sigma24 family protein